jgi:hypothetical protein
MPRLPKHFQLYAGKFKFPYPCSEVVLKSRVGAFVLTVIRLDDGRRWETTKKGKLTRVS